VEVEDAGEFFSMTLFGIFCQTLTGFTSIVAGSTRGCDGSGAREGLVVRVVDATGSGVTGSADDLTFSGSADEASTSTGEVAGAAEVGGADTAFLSAAKFSDQFFGLPHAGVADATGAFSAFSSRGAPLLTSPTTAAGVVMTGCLAGLLGVTGKSVLMRRGIFLASSFGGDAGSAKVSFSDGGLYDFTK